MGWFGLSCSSKGVHPRLVLASRPNEIAKMQICQAFDWDDLNLCDLSTARRLFIISQNHVFVNVNNIQRCKRSLCVPLCPSVLASSVSQAEFCRSLQKRMCTLCLERGHMNEACSNAKSHCKRKSFWGVQKRMVRTEQIELAQPFPIFLHLLVGPLSIALSLSMPKKIPRFVGTYSLRVCSHSAIQAAFSGDCRVASTMADRKTIQVKITAIKQYQKNVRRTTGKDNPKHSNENNTECVDWGGKKRYRDAGNVDKREKEYPQYVSGQSRQQKRGEV